MRVRFVVLVTGKQELYLSSLAEQLAKGGHTAVVVGGKNYLLHLTLFDLDLSAKGLVEVQRIFYNNPLKLQKTLTSHGWYINNNGFIGASVNYTSQLNSLRAKVYQLVRSAALRRHYKSRINYRPHITLIKFSNPCMPYLIRKTLKLKKFNFISKQIGLAVTDKNGQFKKLLTRIHI